MHKAGQIYFRSLVKQSRFYNGINLSRFSLGAPFAGETHCCAYYGKTGRRVQARGTEDQTSL